MKNIMKKILIIFCFITITTISTYSIADVGSFDRYDSGASDWGSSSWSSSDYDWGSSSSSSDWDWDWGSSSSSSSWNSDSDGDLLFLFGWLFGRNTNGFGGFILLIIAYFVIRAIIRHGFNSNRRTDIQRNIVVPQKTIPSSVYTQGREPIVNTEKSPIVAKQIQEFDALFSEEKMLQWSRNLFVKLQNAWTARDWEPMRPFETEELFDQHYNQIKRYIDTDKINVIDRIAVNYATLYAFKQEGDKDILEVVLKSTMKDYIINANTKAVLEGYPEQDRITVYKLTFERKHGVLTEEGEIKLNTTNCPNCGAPTNITSSGKCNYCGSVITTRDYGWVLAGLEPFRQ